MQYAKQTLELTRLRGHLEYDFLQKKKNKEALVISDNMQKLEEKKQADKLKEEERIKQEKERVEMMVLRGQKQNYKNALW